MTAVWRDEVPFKPLIGTFRERRQTSKAVFQPEIGEPVQRLRSTFTPVSAEMTLSLTTHEKDLFDAMYRDDFGEGSLEFKMRHPISGAWKTWIFTAEPQDDFAAPRCIVALSLLRLD